MATRRFEGCQPVGHEETSLSDAVARRALEFPRDGTRYRGFRARLNSRSDLLARRWGVIVPLTIVVALVRIAMTLVLPYDRVVNLFEDDAFYYFGVARHIAIGDGSTFNSLDPTNGYHPLWLLLLVPIFAISDGRGAFVGVIILSGILYVLSGLLLRHLGSILQNPAIVSISAAPLLLVGAVGPTFWFTGMETGLLLTTMLAVAVFFVRSDGLAAAALSTKKVALLGALIALMVLARLDAVFPAAILMLVALWTWRQRPKAEFFRLTLGLALPPAVTLAVYLAANLVIFGTWLPVSGQAKAIGGADSPNFGIVYQFLTAPLFVGGTPSWWGMLVVLVTPIALLIARRPFAASARMAAILMGGSILMIFYYALNSTWKLWPWYFYSAPLALALAAPALIDRLRIFRSRGTVIMMVTSIGVVTLAIANAAYLSGTEAIRGAWKENGPRLAEQLAGLRPVDAPLAMGDRAGSLGFHLARPLVHLEGLVNSPEYLDALRNGSVDVFLKERRVAFYARADTSPGRPKPQAGPGCAEFLEPDQGAGTKASIVVCADDIVAELPLSDGTAYRVWRYRPEINN